MKADVPLSSLITTNVTSGSGTSTANGQRSRDCSPLRAQSRSNSLFNLAVDTSLYGPASASDLSPTYSPQHYRHPFLHTSSTMSLPSTSSAATASQGGETALTVPNSSLGRPKSFSVGSESKFAVHKDWTSKGTWSWQEHVIPYIPLIGWVVTTAGFLLVIGIWRSELFEALDKLSVYLRTLGFLGYLILGTIIFITTFPPLPLYSTLIILSGYAFGAWPGFFVSYIAAISGALAVFLLSRTMLRPSMHKMLSKSPGLKRIIRAIEKKPSLLFLIRLAPYPYNVMNTIMAASNTLTLRTYMTCTATSLFKLIIHTTIGSTVRDWGDSAKHGPGTPEVETPSQVDERQKGEFLKKCWSMIGITLCVGLFLYLTIVARHAVDALDDETPSATSLNNAEEGMSFLGNVDGGDENEEQELKESRASDSS